jgi:hypothetical protein
VYEEYEYLEEDLEAPDVDVPVPPFRILFRL